MSRRERHVRQLAAEHGVSLALNRQREWVPGDGYLVIAWYRPTTRHAWVNGWDGRSQLGYFAALHEIGHAVVGIGSDLVASEAAAWEWALDQAIEEPGPLVRQYMRDYWFGTYVRDLEPFGPEARESIARIGTRFGIDTWEV